MIFVFVALYQEAKPLIRALQLKKQQQTSGFDVYENKEVRLILSGTGALSAATAVGSSLAFFGAGEEDLLVNWGSCAEELSGDRNKKSGVLYCCNKLVDSVSHHTYYPDMFVKSELPEACVVTETKVWADTDHCKRVVREGLMGGSDDVILHDMEAAAIYFAGAHFFAPHQMHFVKTVTDFGDGSIPLENFSELMEKAAPFFLSYLEQLKNWQKESIKIATDRWERTEEQEKILEEFCCSETMKAMFLQCIHYWSLAGTDYRKELEKMRVAGELPCRDKREGKKRFEQLRENLL